MEEPSCDLEVDVNGEEIFMVDKRIISSFSGKFNKLFGKSNGGSTKRRNLKVIFHDFPGGVEGFELISRYCYNNGDIEITASNIVLLSCAARFMEMNQFDNKPLVEINYMTWSELILALKQCQGFLLTTDSSFLLEKILDCLIERLVSRSVASPHYTSFSENSSFKFSCDTWSTSDSIKNNYSQRTWWFEDLLFLNVDLVEKVVKMMVPLNFDHDMISKFLFYYRKSRFLDASQAEKCRITVVVINLLYLLDRSSLSHSCKGLFHIYRVASSLNISKHYIKKLESLIGSQLDQTTVDYLLVPSPRRKACVYDVSLVLRLVKAFIDESRSWLWMSRLNKVAGLLDLYITEVSPDHHLKPSKFAALLMVLPDSTRQSHDRLYHAIDMYLEVHAGLCEEEKMKICSVLNYKKLSTDVLKHLAMNSKFPSSTLAAVKSFINQQSELRIDKENMGQKADAEKILLYAKRHYLPKQEGNFEAQFHGMQWKVMELEKLYSITQTQMGDLKKKRLSSPSNATYLPKLCS